MIRNRFFALLTALCLLVSTVPIHSHASQTDSLDTLYHSRHHRDATRQVQTDSRGQRLISQSTQSVLPAGDNEFLVSNILDGNCQWGIADDGFLYIWCDGEMPHREAEQYPWSAYKSLYTKLYVGSGTVADNAFANCDNLQMVLLEEDVTAIGQNAFANCMALEEFWFYGAAPTIAENAFSGTQTLLISHYDDDSFASITGKNFGGNLSWVTWIEAVDGGMYGTVEWTVFEDMSMQLNGTGSSMQSQASAENYPWYSWSTHITYLSCESISQLGNYAFADFTALEYAEFDQSLAAIGSKTFYNCDGITLVFVGDAPSLGEEAFCSSDLYLEYPEDNPTWTDAAVMLFFGIVLDENELPLDWPTTEGPSNELPLDKPSDVSPPDKPIPPADTPQEVTCAITAQQVYNAMIALQPQYPEGMHWTNDDYYAWNGGYFTGGYGCAGFAFILSDAAFGTEPCRLIEENITIDDIRVGDILRINNDTHSVIVLEVHADHVVIAEGNFNSSIHWGRTLSAQTVADVTNYIMTRYPEHRWSAGTCLESRVCQVCGISDGVTGSHVYTDDSDSDCNLCGFRRETESQPAAGMPLSDFELEVLRLTNLERLAIGLNPLTATELLQTATDIRAQEIMEYFSHTRPNGTTCFTVMDELGVPYWSAAENIAYGYRSPDAVVAGWMNSEGHRKNILTPALGHMGVGEISYNWVQLFTDAPAYTSIRVPIPEGTIFQPGTEIDDMGLVAILRNSNGDCWLPLASAYCSGYDPNMAGSQTVTVSVLGVSCVITVTVEGHTHTWVDATCETPRTCTECGKAEGAPLGHNWTAATCKAPKTCTVCGKTEGSPADHNWDAGVITTVPTFETDGEITFTCLTCGTVRKEAILSTAGPFTKVDKPDTVASSYGFSYDIPADGATVLIFFSPLCGNSQYLMQNLNHSIWMTNPLLNVVAVDCYSGSDANLEAFRNTYTPDMADHIQYLYADSNAIAFDYYEMMGGGSSLTWPLVMVITGTAENPVIRYGAKAMTDYPKLKEVLDHVSPAFAGWDGTVHEHTWIPATCQTPKTCSECGATEGTVADHSWLDATCQTPMTCSVCGATSGEPNSHNWEYATCTAPQTCLECGQTEGEPLEHTWEDATCLVPKTCFECGITEGEPLPHRWEDATCLVPKTCHDCGTTEGTPLPHVWAPADCLVPSTCTLCYQTQGEPLGHDWQDATCQMPKFCPRCSATEGTPAPHDFRDGCCTVCLLPERMIGDANGDGKITYDDALKVLRASISLDTLPADVMQACDVDGSGRLDYNDALLILRYSIKLITEFPQKK